MKAGLAGLMAVILGFSGCVRRPPPVPPPAPHPHYLLGAPYQAGGHWFYPEEDYASDRTGIAAIAATRPGTLTADGEARDPGALTAAMPTVQLPAIAEVTNLANGRQILVRVNDRGPANPARIIALSPRAALLLQIPPEGAPVGVRIDTAMSHALTDQAAGGPKLAIAAAAPTRVTVESLPPPGSASGPGAAHTLGGEQAPGSAPPIPERLPEQIRQTALRGGSYWLQAGVFSRFNYANVRASRLARLGGEVVHLREGRQETYAVRAGPFRSIAEADRALSEALALGIPDATITYE